DRFVIAGGGQAVPVRGEGAGVDRGGVGFEHRFLFAGAGVPEPDRSVPAGGGQGVSVRGEGAGVDNGGVSFEHRFLLAGASIPQPDRFVIAGGGQGVPVRGEGAGVDTAGVAFEQPGKSLRFHDPALAVKPGPGTGSSPSLELRGYHL
ncbi:MAG: hypothetical protein R6U40_12915, partial [Desulfobacterales bacterium]